MRCPIPNRWTALAASLTCVAAATVSALAPPAVAEPPAAHRPNFLILLADDLGYGDLACYGHEVIQSPNLDRLAREGLRLTDCYSAGASCSPSRTGLMTGRTPYRVGIHGYIPWNSPMHVRAGELTVATLLKQAGYATCHVGKWHLNGRFNVPEQPQPSDHGFDHWFSTQNNALPNHHNPDNFVRNGAEVGRIEGYSAAIVADEAIAWLEHLRPHDRPFFLYVCFHEPHEPIATDPRYADLYDHSPDDPSRAAYYGNVTQMDSACGRILAALDKAGLRDSTLVFFTSDNGPAVTRYHPHGSAGPLREKKGHVYEGGIRVPAVIRWPGHTTPGQTSDEPVCGVDLLPTLCHIAAVPVPADRAIDGANFLPLLSGGRVERTVPLYWQYNHAASRPRVAMRVGDWKILAGLTATPLTSANGITVDDMRILKTSALSGFELYNLRDDIGETTDLSRTHPEKLRELEALLTRMYDQVRGESPTWPATPPDRYESQRIIWSTYGKP